VIQAEARGVTSVRTLAEVCPGGHYVLVKSPSKVSNARTLAFARNEVGSKYGFFTIASIVLNLLSPEWMTFRWTNSWICSAVSAEALRFGGWLQRWPDIYQVTPQQLYDALTKTTSK